MIEINNTTSMRIDKKLLLRIARGVFRKEKVSRPSLSVAFLSAAKARELNRSYRKKSCVPNVLSFSYGEIVLCPARISHDAKKYGITFKQELARVFVHGLLHVLGYSHKEMARKEKEYAGYSRS